MRISADLFASVNVSNYVVGVYKWQIFSFIVTTILLGIDPWSAMVIVVVIVMILVNLLGLMYW
jgi:hypothetical protein